MFEFMGIGLDQALASLPAEKSAYYRSLVAEGDIGYYRKIGNSSGRLAALSKAREIEACVVISGHIHRVDPDYIRAIMRSEAGWPGAAIRNTNNSYDVGIMQVNREIWDKEFTRKGVTLTWSFIQNDACANIFVGSYILADRMRNAPSVYEGLANYHRYMTKDRRGAYLHVKYRLGAVGNLIKIYEEREAWARRQQSGDGVSALTTPTSFDINVHGTR